MRFLQAVWLGILYVSWPAFVPCASAGNLSSTMENKAAAPAPSLPDWGGLYIGAFLGGSTDQHDLQYQLSLTSAPSFIYNEKKSDAKGAVIFGAFAGYNYQYAKYILGYEVEAGIKPKRDHASSIYVIPSTSNNDVLRYNQSGSLLTRNRVRAGYLFTPHLFIYMTTGLSLSNPNVSASEGPAQNVTANISTHNANMISQGLNIGIGSEYMLSSKYMLRAEYVHDIFKNDNVIIHANQRDVSYSLFSTFDTFRAGISRKF